MPAPSGSGSWEERGGHDAPTAGLWSRLRGSLLPGTGTAADTTEMLLPPEEGTSAADAAHLTGSEARWLLVACAPVAAVIVTKCLERIG